ncbi:MAG TPA: protein kinase, partial [Labilithrix sp.]|nr:protein kinase [Labilithrix sp.]
DRFKLSRMIGRGGMGSVWQATDLRLSTVCAVKFIEGEMANMAEAHSRFQREAQAAAQLRSPHVVQIFDHGVWQGHPYIAMELLDGEDLGKRIAKQGAGNGGRLPSGVVNAVVQQVCRALSKAHAAGVVHRDLKPDNIFLVTDDDREIVKILDFGVAKSASQAIDGSNTKTGAMLGTPYYMSPEQAQGIKSVDSRSDLWSLAVIVFQCLTGRLPFESEALGDLLVKIIVNPIPQPSAYNGALPPSFDQWWARAADRNPDNRFQTAKEFAESLGLALGQSSVTDVNDRTRLMRQVGGQTAMMPEGVLGNVANTPMPGAQTAAMATPNPHMQTPQGVHPMQTPHGMHSPSPYGAPPPMMATPQAPPQYGAVTTGNPITGTFPGVEPSAGVPKKGAPVALIVGGLLLALIGVGLGGAAMLKGRAHASSDPPGTGSSASAGSGAAAGKAPEVVATETAPVASAKEPEPPPAVTAPSASASVAANPVPVVPVPAGGGGHRQPISGTVKTGTTKVPTAAATAAAAAPAASKEKPINLGF